MGSDVVTKFGCCLQVWYLRVSSVNWAAPQRSLHLLFSSRPWWYGSGATIQVLLFAQLAAKLKLNAPNAHTFLEIIGERWGTLAHKIFLFFGLATNIIVSSMLILGGSATVTALSGMNTIAVSLTDPIRLAVSN